MCAEVSGFFYPRTATGRSSLLPPPPWHYSGDLLTVEYRTDPARVRRAAARARCSPPPEDPGAVALIWADWQSCGDGRGRSCSIRCGPSTGSASPSSGARSRAGSYSRCVYIWVDTDFALARGLHQGYPKKLGLDPPDQAAPVRPGRAADRAGRHVRRDAGRRRPPAGPGGRHAARAGPGERLRQRAPDGAPPVDALDREGRAGLRSDELIESGSASVRGRPGLARRRHARAVRVADRGTGPPRGRRDHRRLLPPGRRHLGRRPLLNPAPPGAESGRPPSS